MFRHRLIHLSLAAFLVALSALPAAAQAPPPAIVLPEASPHRAPEGKVNLVWQVPETNASLRFELQQASSPDFASPRTRYRGPDRGTYLSGLPAGDYYYRVRRVGDGGGPGAWSEPFVVRVEYASMRLVFVLMSMGLIVFAATVATVLVGHRRAARRDAVQT